MFRCERCGSRYNAMYAAAFENCPRCQIRDRTAAPLTFKAFHLPDSVGRKAPAAPSAHVAEKTPAL